MAELSTGLRALRSGGKLLNFWRYYLKRNDVLTSALRDGLTDALKTAAEPVSQDHAAYRVAASSVIHVLKHTEVKGQPPVRSWLARLVRHTRELVMLRFPQTEPGEISFEARLSGWIADALLSDDGHRALSGAGLVPVTSLDHAHHIAVLATRGTLRRIRVPDGDGGFKDKVRNTIIREIDQEQLAMERRSGFAESLAVGVGVGTASVAVTDATTSLPPAAAAGVGLAVAVVTTLGVAIARRSEPLSQPQFEVRRAVLMWLCTVLVKMFDLRPESVTVHDVRACLERAIGRFEGAFGTRLAVFDETVVSPDGAWELPGRARLKELITLAGSVGDPGVQAALISLDADTWCVSTKYGAIGSFDRVLRALSS